jgi:Zn-dependent membrane protease YugP
MDIYYIGVIAIMLILGLGSQALIKGTFKKWSKVPASSQATGAEMARRMLDSNGLSHVEIQRVGGSLSDHYDPRTKVVSLSEAVYDGRTVAASAVACHECGHALQHAQGYVPITIRSAVVPVVNIASQAWIFVLIIGFVLSQIGLVYLAILMYAVVILFQLITLPVEFNASKRAKVYLNTAGYMPPQESGGARSVLSAAAFTYVAAALSSILYLVYLLGFRR